MTGEILPLVYLGPAGARAPATSPTAWRCSTGRRSTKNPFRLAPRIGFAWDVTGDGRTAVRGGAGVFYDRYSDDNILDLIELPPLLNTYTTNYTTLPELLASPLTATPTAVRFIDAVRSADGLQLERRRAARHRLEFRGRRRLRRQRRARAARSTAPINGRPYGYAYQASSLDPTNVVGGSAAAAAGRPAAAVPRATRTSPSATYERLRATTTRCSCR